MWGVSGESPRCCTYGTRHKARSRSGGVLRAKEVVEGVDYAERLNGAHGSPAAYISVISAGTKRRPLNPMLARIRSGVSSGAAPLALVGSLYWACGSGGGRQIWRGARRRN